MTDLSYNQFRAAHKGTPQKEISTLWAEYKDGKYQLPKASTPAKEITVPVGVVEVNIKPGLDESYGTEDDKVVIRKVGTVETTSQETPAPRKHPKPLKESPPVILELCKEYVRLQKKMKLLGPRLTPELKADGLSRLQTIADETIPSEYSCTTTDSWKIWFGPTSKSLLINTTNPMAFEVTREWWSTHYQSTIYVDRELLNNNSLIESETKRYFRMGRFLPRPPVVGNECKLPQGVKDIHIRGGQGMN